MSSLIQARAYFVHGPGARAVILGIAALATLAAWCAGYLATLELSPFRMAVIVAGLASLPVLMVHFELLPPLFLGLLWARVSDVAIATHGVPSIATPLAALLLAVSLLRKSIAGRISFSTFSDLTLALPYAAVVSLSALWSTVVWRSLENASILLKDLVIFWMFADALRDRRTLLRASEIVVIAAALLSLPSLHQYFTNSFTLNYAGFAQSEILNIVGGLDSHRLGGPLNSPNYFALILLITVPIGMSLLRTSLPTAERVALATMLAPVMLTVLLTFSRGGSILLALLVLVSLQRLRYQPIHLLVGAIILGAVVMMTPSRVWDRLSTLAAPITGQTEANVVVDDSVELRLGAQRTAIEMFLSHPFLGVGAGNFPALYQDYSRWLGVRSQAAEYTPHNLYLEILAETGIVGLVTFLITALVPLSALRRARRRFPVDTREGRDHLELSHGLELALVGWLIAGFFEQGAFPRYYWMLLALVIGAAHVDNWAPAPARTVPATAPIQHVGAAPS